MTVASTIAFLKMSTDSPRRGFASGVIAVVQDQQLHSTED
jgi:glutaredoxin-related protein